jgi:type II secretory pathway component PulM
MTRTLSSLCLALALGAAVAGCRNDSNRSSAVAAAPSPSPSASPAPVTSASLADGIVARLTGDQDGQVTPQLEQIVFDAYGRDVDDTPLEGF